MKKRLASSFLMILIAAAASAIFAQTNEQIEAELIEGIKDVQAYSTYGGNYDEDKLTKAQEAFEMKLLKYSKAASTLAYKFSALDEHLSIATSDDGKLRVYSWDMQDGGTMHRFARVYQFQAANGKVFSRTDPVVEDGMGRGYVHHIYTLNSAAGKVYIVCALSIASSKIHQQSADIYKIAGSTLKDDVKLIRTKAGLTNSLSFDYDNFSVIDRNKRPEDLVAFDKRTGTLKIPLVVNDNDYPDGNVTGKTIDYRYNGKYFVKVN